MSLIRVACFWRAEGSEGGLWFDALGVQSLHPQLPARLLLLPRFGGQTSERGL